MPIHTTSSTNPSSTDPDSTYIVFNSTHPDLTSYRSDFRALEVAVASSARKRQNREYLKYLNKCCSNELRDEKCKQNIIPLPNILAKVSESPAIFRNFDCSHSVVAHLRLQNPSVFVLTSLTKIILSTIRESPRLLTKQYNIKMSKRISKAIYQIDMNDKDWMQG